MDRRPHGFFAIHAIAIITFAQLFGTSLWFSANSAVLDLIREWHISVSDIGWLTNSVQAGFIIGTFSIAFTGIADRFKASSIFAISALVGAFFNLCFAWFANGLIEGMIYRFFVGICMAGIYPIGMKLVVQWAPDKAGQVLAKLVAMLTLGTSLPYALNGLSADLPWQFVITFSSFLALTAALLVFKLGDKQQSSVSKTPVNQKSKESAFEVFKNPSFRAAAFGYFGHMWELYAFWTIIPLFIAKSGIPEKLGFNNLALLTFFVMAWGAIGCLFGGYLSKRIGSAKTAIGALFISGFSCLVFVLGWRVLPEWLLLIVLTVWGTSVIADSPQFSALSAEACPPEKLGAALSIQNSFGFAITIVSIGITTYMFDLIGLDSAWVLIIGPILGITGFFYSNRYSPLNKKFLA
ncbi:MFS transporter [Acinetobacter sichuanensis]|uniref:MFS transporter n=1 Tax=Acinetobacter sichuanensis TaxID=2136183 RepID=A0A371YNI4_9GAMM|nr:MFS transporter [Acinetobacter sichuanensis]RFC83029.1 MFS transporter [Acinetobacter sichuanensis]